ncbi:MAG: chaperone modulator CbpM [Flavobacteriales bacterium]
MHYDLEINLEGLEAISHLLDQMDAAQQEARELRERLLLYE